VNPAEAAQSLREKCDEISRLITSMHPTVNHLGVPPIQTEIFRALFELTKQVEVVKKHLIRHQKGDDSKVL